MSAPQRGASLGIAQRYSALALLNIQNIYLSGATYKAMQFAGPGVIVGWQSQGGNTTETLRLFDGIDPSGVAIWKGTGSVQFTELWIRLRTGLYIEQVNGTTGNGWAVQFAQLSPEYITAAHHALSGSK